MIYKESDSVDVNIAKLQALMDRWDCSEETKKRIGQEIRNIQAGARGESEAAYEMKVRWGSNKSFAIIHDLRIEHDDLVAQIDHIIITRLMDVWVCESKHFSEGIAINQHGEFSAFFGGRSRGIPSPIRQNEKHILILNRFFKSGKFPLPSRLGFNITPNLRGLVLVSKWAKVIRPKVNMQGLEMIIKNDQLYNFIDKDWDKKGALSITKLIGADTLADFAKRLVACHKPADFDWAAKFGLPADEPERPAVPKVQPTEAVVVDQSFNQFLSRKKLVCEAEGCGVSISPNVARFCRMNEARFGGKLYCMSCQKQY